jgi:hypothetical protein
MSEGHRAWEIDVAWASSTRFKKLSKRHPAEHDSCWANLNKIKKLLEGGARIGSFKVGFFRSEGGCVYRIGQSGLRDAKETRMYIYPDEEAKILYVLGMGVKETQSVDIREAKGLAREIQKGGNP